MHASYPVSCHLFEAIMTTAEQRMAQKYNYRSYAQ